MSNVVYVSKSKIERKKGPLRIAHVAGEPQPVVFSVHGAIADAKTTTFVQGNSRTGRNSSRGSEGLPQ